MPIRARKITKILLYIFLAINTVKALGEPYGFINETFAVAVADLIYGSANQEQLDDVFYYIAVIFSFLTAFIIYLLITKLTKYLHQI